MQADEDIEAAVRAVLRAVNDALERRDLDGLLTLFASDPDVSLIGSEAGETAVGPSELRMFFEGLFARAGTFSFDWDSSTVSARGDIAWFVADASTRYLEGQHVTEIPYRTTGILERQQDRWLLIHYHGSEPVPPQT